MHVAPVQLQHSNWENGVSMGGTFDIDWIRRYDLPFQDTEGLYNPLNENKPVKICRDGQDLPNDLGERLIQLVEDGAEVNGIPRPKKPSKWLAALSGLSVCVSLCRGVLESASL